MSQRRFNHRALGFSKLNLAYLTYCSVLAYEPKADIGSGLKELGFNLYDNYYFSDDGRGGTNTQGFIAGDNQKIIIGFRGTEPGILKDWITDAKITKSVWTPEKYIGEVHDGFYEALSSVWDHIKAELDRLRNNNQTIWITGHSLGGALAVLAGATLRLQGEQMHVNGIYTYGQPRLGNKEFRNAFNDVLKSKCFRMVNNNDVIARIPPQFLGYTHVGTLRYFDADGKMFSDGQLSWWAKFWDRIEGRIEDLHDLTPDGIGDHDKKMYLKLCEKVLEV